MARDNLGRRLLSALAGTTPAFTPAATTQGRTRRRRLLAALAGTTPAFAPGADTDQYTSQSSAQPRAMPPATPLAGRGLREFATVFAAYPLQKRLAARTWLPYERLADIQSTARSLLRERSLILNSRQALFRASNLAHALARDLDHIRDVAALRAVDLDRGRALVRLFDVGDNLDGTFVFAVISDHASASALVHNLDRAIAGDRSFTLSRWGHRNLNFSMAFIRIRNLVEAIDALDKAVSDVVDADLTQMNLSGIPLDGVRWSDGTRWPELWEVRVRDNSVPIAPGLYEVRPGGVGIDFTTGAPVSPRK
jgi:hypothetical protein